MKTNKLKLRACIEEDDASVPFVWASVVDKKRMIAVSNRCFNC